MVMFTGWLGMGTDCKQRTIRAILIKLVCEMI